MVTVGTWTGRETRALREAKRMSLREFAAHLGVSDRTVSKWEAGGERIRLRPDSQAILDTALERASSDVRTRFAVLVGDTLFSATRTQAASGHSARPAERVGQPNSGLVRHPTTGKSMVLVPAGPFRFGSANRVVQIPSFFIDMTPVTNADYSVFIAATRHRAPLHWPGGECPEDLRDHPVVNVTHRDVEAYCAWAGTALPSEEQWEKTARGEHGQTYPWGDQATIAKCNVRESGIGRTTPVERYHSGVSPYGVYDLSGNVWEWCSTETSPGRYVLKGSAFTSPFSMAMAAATNDASSEMFDDDTGFRCVAPSEEIDRSPSS